MFNIIDGNYKTILVDACTKGNNFKVGNAKSVLDVIKDAYILFS